MSKLSIKLIKKKPHKVYKADIESDSHTKDLCRFLRRHQDRTLQIILNGKSIKFDSIAGRKRFASGFEAASRIIYQHVKSFANDSHGKINALTSELNTAKKQYEQNNKAWLEAQEKYRVKSVVMDIREAAYKDQIAELEDNCEILKAKAKPVRKVKRGNNKKST